MPKTLFPYQQKLIDDLRPALRDHKWIIAQSPTGSGKSVILAAITTAALAAGKTILVLSETAKIFEQLVKECGGIRIDSAIKHLHIKRAACYVAMSQSLANREAITDQLNQLGSSLIILIDECHINTMTRVIDRLPNALRVGFTATPAFKWAKHLPRLYKHIVLGPQVHDLIASGHLSPYKYYARVSAKQEDLVMKGGEFTEQSQATVFGRVEVLNGIYEDLRSISFRKCLIFVSSIAECESTYASLIEQGFPATRYHSQLPNAHYALSMFNQINTASICVTVRALNKGWDYKPIDLIILKMATTSLPVFLQSIGRGCRVMPDKPYFTILDYGGNYTRHGLYDEDRDWATLWHSEGPKRKKGTSPVRMCPECEYINPASARVCKGCGYAFAPVPKTPEETRLIEVTERYSKLKGKLLSDLTPDELAIYANHTKRKPLAIRVATAMDQSQSGYLRAFAANMGYKPGWVWMRQREHPEGQPIHFSNLKIV